MRYKTSTLILSDSLLYISLLIYCPVSNRQESSNLVFRDMTNIARQPDYHIRRPNNVIFLIDNLKYYLHNSLRETQVETDIQRGVKYPVS